MKERLQNAWKCIPVVLFLTFTVFLYGPLSLFLPNADEFWFGLNTVITVVIPFSLAVFSC